MPLFWTLKSKRPFDFFAKKFTLFPTYGALSLRKPKEFADRAQPREP
jgi:hypothetical protein